MDRRAAGPEQRPAELHVGTAECHRRKPLATRRRRQDAAYVVGSHDIGLDHADRGKREPGTRIAGAERPNAVEKLDQLDRRAGWRERTIDIVVWRRRAAVELTQDVIGEKFAERFDAVRRDRETGRPGMAAARESRSLAVCLSRRGGGPPWPGLGGRMGKACL